MQRMDCGEKQYTLMASFYYTILHYTILNYTSLHYTMLIAMLCYTLLYYYYILLILLPESFRVLLSFGNYTFFFSHLTGITKFKYNRTKEMNSGFSSQKTTLST